MSTHLILVHALSPLHCGTGQAVSGIDLPIAREKPTGIPLIPGSSLKGVLRAHPNGYELEPNDKKRQASVVHLAAFGPETENASEFAGAVQFGDAHLLFLPIRSVRGTFAWVTCPHILRRLARDVRGCNVGWSVPSVAALPDQEALVASKERLGVKIQGKERIVFEDFDFSPRTAQELTAFAQGVGGSLYGKEAKEDVQHFVERVCVVSDDVFRVLGRVGMEVVARNRISNESKTVERGALWTEEALPAETILTGLLTTTVVRPKPKEEEILAHVKALSKNPMQIGGKATVGRGVCKVEVL